MKILPLIFEGFFFVVLLQIPFTKSQSSCEPGEILVAGSLPVGRLADAWKTGYLAEKCGDSETTTINIDSGGSSTGAARVCGTRASELPVDIGGMTRSFNDQEASSEDGWRFTCNRSTRSAIQVEVGVDGVAVAVAAGSAGHNCIQDHLGGGLTFDQLRWLYSNYDETELKEWGWDATSVPFSDGDRSTRKWSELSKECLDTEIFIAGPPEGSNEWDIFDSALFLGNDETFDLSREGSFFTANPENSTTELTEFLVGSDSTIGYFGIVSVLTELDLDELALVNHIDDGGNVIKPSGVAFQDGLFPYTQRLYMNFYDDEESLAKTRPFLEYGLFSEGADDIAKSVGIWPINDIEKMVGATRLETASGVPVARIQAQCGPENGKITVAGSTTVFPVADLWARIYMVGCPAIRATVEGGGSSGGAGRVCDNEEKGTPVTIGSMSRDWEVPDEAKINVEEDFIYECEKGDTSRSSIQVDVAIDGLTVAVQKGGSGWSCIEKMGGLTVHQLRWLFSSYNEDRLEATGWDPRALKNSDNDSSTHRWNELDPSCEDEDIRIAGPADTSGTNEYFLETILVDFKNGETFAPERPFKYEAKTEYDLLVEYLENYGSAISYFGYSFYYENRAFVSSVAIENDKGEFILPDRSTIGDGSYNPLSRRIYMNLLNSQEAISDSAPYIKFGLNHPELVAATGYVALPDDVVDALVVERVDPAPHGSDDKSDDNSNKAAIIGGSVAAVVVLLCLVFICFKKGVFAGEDAKDAAGNDSDATEEARPVEGL